MRLTKAEKERLYSTVTQEDRDYYLQKTGMEATDSFIKMLFLIYREHNSLAKLVGAEGSKVKPEERVKQRLNDIANNWNRSELLIALKSDGYVTVNGSKIYIDPQKLAELQHYKGVLYANNSVMKATLSGIINRSPNHQTDEDRTDAVHRYIDRIVQGYKSDEVEID